MGPDNRPAGYWLHRSWFAPPRSNKAATAIRRSVGLTDAIWVVIAATSGRVAGTAVSVGFRCGFPILACLRESQPLGDPRVTDRDMTVSVQDDVFDRNSGDGFLLACRGVHFALNLFQLSAATIRHRVRTAFLIYWSTTLHGIADGAVSVGSRSGFPALGFRHEFQTFGDPWVRDCDSTVSIHKNVFDRNSRGRFWLHD